MADKVDKKKAFMRASIEMLEDAEQRVKDKYSRYENSEDKMNEIIEDIKWANEQNKTQAQNAGYTNEDIRNAEYTKVNGLEVEKYQRHLKKIGMTDEQMHEKAYGNVEIQGAIASSSTKEKEKKKGMFSFSKRRKETKVNENEIVSDINPMERSKKGEGYMEEKQTKTDFVPENNNEDKTKETISDSVIQEAKPEPTKLDKPVPKLTTPYTFDYSSIPDYVQYDIIPLPSNGECYPSKCGRIPVRYLTAADENLIASPNLYANGQLIDALLKRCILDKTFDVDNMCTGDRDAVVLWLRATAYGSMYPVSAMNRETGKIYNTTVNLSEFKFIESKLKGDENGWFTFKSDTGNVIKYKLLSKKDIDDVFNETIGKYVNNAKLNLLKSIGDVERSIKAIEEETNQHDETLDDAVAYIREWVGESEEGNTEEIYSKAVTENMIKYTMEINGNRDREYIRNYVENMRAMEARKYRDFVTENRPGVDLSVSIPIPESDGGGSFDTFLNIGDTIFINVE